MQRFLDLFFSSLALFVLSPLLVPVAIILRFSGEGEVFYFQERIGKDGKPFQLFKFVTMLKNSPNIGTGTVTMKGDPRVLPVGKFLRKTKINELPQLLNIVIGDMSVIGPRPLTEQAFSTYPKHAQRIVTQVRPGLSGVGSIIFHQEEEILAGELGSIDFYKVVLGPYKSSLEVWYVNNQGLATYFTAIFLTVLAIIFPSSAVAWRAFSDLPVPPDTLKKFLHYPEGH
ncbi:WcaJ Sugar transferases involved in lipopolysaccharide synthesis [Burkholderiaceae bacterium]